MKITVKYFASLREIAQKNEEIILTDALTPKDLYCELSEKYNFFLQHEDLKVAINNEFQSLTTPLHDQDIVVFIPPVAGG